MEQEEEGRQRSLADAAHVIAMANQSATERGLLGLDPNASDAGAEDVGVHLKDDWKSHHYANGCTYDGQWKGA